MAQLTDRELEILNRELDKRGLTYTRLQKELLDHLCCDIEAKMDEGIEFLKAFEEVRKRLENDRIQKIQEETLLLINQKYRMMKKFMYVLGTIAPTFLIVGAIFKMMHWFGASILLTLGTFLLAVIYLPVFAMVSIRDTREKGKKVNKPLYIIGVIAGFIFLTGILFKINHWPGAGIALLVSVLIMVVLFIPFLVVHAIRDKENQIQNFSILIFILAMMGVNIMVIALKVSKDVLGTMKVSTEQSILASRSMETINILSLEEALASENDSPPQTERAELLSEKSDALDTFIQELMAEIVLFTHEDNRQAVGANQSLDLDKAIQFDVHRSVSQVIFGDENIKGKGEDLVALLESYREILLENAGPELDSAINQLLFTGTMGREQKTWLSYNFNEAPMIGALNILSNLQVRVRYLEGEVLRDLQGALSN
jgi:flagellar motor component MotA